VPHPPLVLASTSPYRRELLARLRLPFEVAAPGLEEAALAGESARDTALRLAGAKALAVAQKFPRALVIGSDQVAALGGEQLGKPGSHPNAVAQLKAMRGKTVLFHTAVALLDSASGSIQLAEVPTEVRFRDYSDAEIERYLEAERPYDCAGSAKIEGLGIVLIDYVRSDDPSALVGLPLVQLSAMLRKEGVPLV
jgi:septum formation protein